MRNNRTNHTNYRKLWRSSEERDVLGKRENWKEMADSGPAMAVLDTPDTTIDYRQAWQQNPQAPGMASGIAIGGCFDPDVTFDQADFSRETPQRPDHGKGKLVIPPDGGCF